jgi:hypothetical protein
MTQFKIDLNRVSSITNKRDFSEIASACSNISQLHSDKFGIAIQKKNLYSIPKSTTTQSTHSNETISGIIDQVLTAKKFYGENSSTADNSDIENCSKKSGLAIEDVNTGKIIEFDYFSRTVSVASKKIKRDLVFGKKNAGLKNKKWDSEDRLRFYKGLELFG